MHVLGTRRPRADGSATPTAVGSNSHGPGSRVISRFNRIPVIDSLVPTVHSNGSVTPSDHEQLTNAVAVVLAFVGVSAIIAMVFVVVRYLMRRAAIKRCRQASWILRSGHWNMEPKRTDAHETRTGRSDASSGFSAYPYPLSEHF